MRRRIVALAGQPEFWLGLLLIWTLLSALRAWHTPWMRAADTEALRWDADIGLALALGRGLHRIESAAQAVTVLLGSLVTAILLCGLGPSGRTTGPYGDHQLCASALLVLLPFALALALAADAPRWRWAGQVVSLAAVVCLALTQTRSAWLGATVAALVFTTSWAGLPHAGPWVPRRSRLIPALLVLAVGVSFVLLVGRAGVGRPLAGRAVTLGAVAHDASWQERSAAWREALPMAASHPLAGWGLGRYPLLQWNWTHLGHPLPPLERPSLSEQAHDLYLQTLIEIGVVGLGFYLAALTALGMRCRRALRAPGAHQGRLPRALQVAALTLLAGQGVDALASPSYQFAEVSLLFWALLGVGLAVTRNQAEPAWRRAAEASPVLRVCIAGAAAVFLVTLTVPTGLLLPVEAYSPPAGWVYQKQLRISPQNAVLKTGQTLQYQLQALYQTPNGMAWADVTLANSPNTFFGIGTAHGTKGNSSFGSGNTRSVLTASSQDVGNSGLLVSGTFQPNYGTGPVTITTPITITN